MLVISKKVIVALLFAVFIADVSYAIYLDVHYAYDMPRSSEPETGRVCSITVNHGFVVYVTQQERSRYFFAEKLVSIGGGLVFCAAAILLASLRRKREGRPQNRA
jgi:hypothetical protein